MKNRIIIGVALTLLLVGCAAFAVSTTSNSNTGSDMTATDSGDIFSRIHAILESISTDSEQVNKKVSKTWISADGYTRLKYSTSTGNGLQVIDYDGDDRDYINVPDYIVYKGQTYIVDKISERGLNWIG